MAYDRKVIRNRQFTIMKYITPNVISFGSERNERSSVGHTFYNWLASLLISKMCGIELLHDPFKADTAKFEPILNLGKHFKTINDVEFTKLVKLPNLDFGHRVINQKVINSNIERVKQIVSDAEDGTVFVAEHGGQFPGVLIDDSEFVCEMLQDSYNNPQKFEYEKGKINVAVHIRRGDITERGNSDRWKNNQHYLQIIKDVKEKLGDRVKVFIFSEGHPLEFQMFTREGCELVLGGSDIKTLDGFVNADILVTGHSTFSLLAVYLNKSTIIYTPCLNFCRYDNFESDRFIKYDEILEKLCIENF